MNDLILDNLLLNLLNLSSNDVTAISSSNVNGVNHLSVTLSHPSDPTCPVCGSSQMKSLGYYTKNIKLANDAFRNHLVSVRVPRRKCLKCGTSTSFTKGMNPHNSTISYDIVLKIMHLLQNPEITFARCAELTGVSESTVVRTFDKHCHISRNTFPEALCIDEVYTKLTDHKEGNRFSKFSCVFYDFYNHQLIDILPSRTKSHLHHYFQSVSTSERAGVKYVVIDMYKPYSDIIKIYFKRAVICVDSFHVIKHLNDSLSKLRIRIMKSYDSSSLEYYLLKKWNFLLFDRHIDLDNEGKMNHKIGYIVNRRQIRELILDIDPVLKTAWELKELYSDFNISSSYDQAKIDLPQLIQKFFAADIPEYREFASTLNNWRNEIINSFILYKGRRLNNGVAESLNSRISLLLFNTKGMRSSERRRKRILYAINRSGFSIK